MGRYAPNNPKPTVSEYPMQITLTLTLIPRNSLLTLVRCVSMKRSGSRSAACTVVARPACMQIVFLWRVCTASHVHESSSLLLAWAMASGTHRDLFAQWPEVQLALVRASCGCVHIHHARDIRHVPVQAVCLPADGEKRHIRNLPHLCLLKHNTAECLACWPRLLRRTSEGQISRGGPGAHGPIGNIYR